MTYEAPSFTEVRMDAEIGSYQEDFEFEPDEPAFVAAEQRSQSAHSSPRSGARIGRGWRLSTVELRL
jgi:hypothetical protein